MNRLIVMDGVSGVADISKNFTNIFNIFPASVPQNTVVKILQSNCISSSKKYVAIPSLLLNRVFTGLANSHKKHCLTTERSYKNKNIPGRYRSLDDNPEEQVCNFNKPNDDEYYNVFISKRIKTENFSESIYFKIERLRRKIEKENFGAEKTLEDSASNDRLSKAFSILKSEQIGAGAGKRHGDSIEHLYIKDKKSARLKYLSGRQRRSIKEKIKRTAKKKYRNTKVKVRNLLTNAFYRRFKRKDFNSASFINDILSFIVQYFTPINLDRRLDNEKDKFMVKLLQDECIPHDFTRYIYKDENYNAISNP